MRHNDCNNWDYATHPASNTVREVCQAMLDELRVNPNALMHGCADTRPLHQRMFSSVTPITCPYLAGNYRGSEHECLRDALVRFGKNAGRLPIGVAVEMDFFHQDLLAAITQFDAAALAATSAAQKRAFLIRLVDLLAATIVRFFSIHPYMNGNGHMGRLIVWILLMHYGHPPVKWTLDKSPPGYADLMDLYRSGKTKPLKAFILKAITGA